MNKILLIEDSEAIIKGLVYSLEQVNLITTVCKTKKEIETLKIDDYDLILLDVTLPDVNGFDLFKEIKKQYNIPIIFLTAKDEEEDIVLGFDLGCDDYVTKPFKIRELISRINRIINNNSKYLECKNIKLDLKSARVYIKEEEVIFTTLEYKILVLLLSNKNKVITRDYLLDRIYDYTDNYVNDNTLTVYIKRIRTKLKDDTIIKTIKGIGYRIDD